MIDELINDENIINIDSRSFLEVADSKHRYGKNLRLYYSEFSKCYETLQNSKLEQDKYAKYVHFFKWLDDPSNKCSLENCSWTTLNEDVVCYLKSEDERKYFQYTINSDGLIYSTMTGELLTTDSTGWIFVLKNNFIYACQKRTSIYPRFHHSSFFAGEGVNAAGILICNQGQLLKLFPHSGHYRPEEHHFFWLLSFLLVNNVDMKKLLVDAQRIYKVSRQGEKDGPKVKKMDCTYFVEGFAILHFLRFKQIITKSGILKQIQSTYDASRKKSSSNSYTGDRIVPSSSKDKMIFTDTIIYRSSTPSCETGYPHDKGGSNRSGGNDNIPSSNGTGASTTITNSAVTTTIVFSESPDRHIDSINTTIDIAVHDQQTTASYGSKKIVTTVATTTTTSSRSRSDSFLVIQKSSDTNLDVSNHSVHSNNGKHVYEISGESNDVVNGQNNITKIYSHITIVQIPTATKRGDATLGDGLVQKYLESENRQRNSDFSRNVEVLVEKCEDNDEDDDNINDEDDDQSIRSDDTVKEPYMTTASCKVCNGSPLSNHQTSFHGHGCAVFDNMS